MKKTSSNYHKPHGKNINLIKIYLFRRDQLWLTGAVSKNLKIL